MARRPRRTPDGFRGFTRDELLREANPATSRTLRTREARAELARRDRLAARPNRGNARPGAAEARRELERRESRQALARFDSPAARARAQRQRLQAERRAASAPAIPAPRAASATAARTAGS